MTNTQTPKIDQYIVAHEGTLYKAPTSQLVTEYSKEVKTARRHIRDSLIVGGLALITPSVACTDINLVSTFMGAVLACLPLRMAAVFKSGISDKKKELSADHQLVHGFTPTKKVASFLGTDDPQIVDDAIEKSFDSRGYGVMNPRYTIPITKPIFA